MQKNFARFAADLVDGFQTVGGEAGHGDEDPLGPLLGQLTQLFIGVGFEPTIPAKQ